MLGNWQLEDHWLYATDTEVYNRLADAAEVKGIITEEDRQNPYSKFNQDYAALVVDEEGELREQPPRAPEENWRQTAKFLDEYGAWDVDRENWDY